MPHHSGPAGTFAQLATAERRCVGRRPHESASNAPRVTAALLPSLRVPIGAVEIHYAPLSPTGPDEEAAEAAPLSEQRLRQEPEENEAAHACEPQYGHADRAHATDQKPGGRSGAPGQERPGHLAPVEEVGHLPSPLPDRTAMSRRADWIELRRWISRRETVGLPEMRGDGAGDATTLSSAITLRLVTLGGLLALQPGAHDPDLVLHLLALLKPSNASRSRTTAWRVSGLSPSVDVPAPASLRRTVACIVCSSLSVYAELVTSVSAALGRRNS